MNPMRISEGLLHDNSPKPLKRRGLLGPVPAGPVEERDRNQGLHAENTIQT